MLLAHSSLEWPVEETKEVSSSTVHYPYGNLCCVWDHERPMIISVSINTSMVFIISAATLRGSNNFAITTFSLHTNITFSLTSITLEMHGWLLGFHSATSLVPSCKRCCSTCHKHEEYPDFKIKSSTTSVIPHHPSTTPILMSSSLPIVIQHRAPWVLIECCLIQWY